MKNVLKNVRNHRKNWRGKPPPSKARKILMFYESRISPGFYPLRAIRELFDIIPQKAYNRLNMAVKFESMDVSARGKYERHVIIGRGLTLTHCPSSKGTDRNIELAAGTVLIFPAKSKGSAVVEEITSQTWAQFNKRLKRASLIMLPLVEVDLTTEDGVMYMGRVTNPDAIDIMAAFFHGHGNCMQVSPAYSGSNCEDVSVNGAPVRSVSVAGEVIFPHAS